MLFIKKNDKILKEVKTKAQTNNIPVSQIIRKAVEYYLSIEEKAESQKRVLDFFTKKEPLSKSSSWEEFHSERMY